MSLTRLLAIAKKRSFADIAAMRAADHCRPYARGAGVALLATRQSRPEGFAGLCAGSRREPAEPGPAEPFRQASTFT